MLKISRLTDYATAVVLFLQKDNTLQSSERIAQATGIEVPTVSKVLKLLTKAQILGSIRGASGGYKLAKNVANISIYDVIIAIEGDAAITECSKIASLCLQEQNCDSRTGWQRINADIKNVLLSMTIAKMVMLNGLAKPKIRVAIKNYDRP